MLGGGGSILVVPVLTYVLGQDVSEATTASLVIVTAAAIAGGAGQARHGNVCFRHAALLTAAALPGIVAGTAAGDAVSGRLLLAVFGAVMLVAAFATARKETTRPNAADGERCPGVRPGCYIGFGVLVGFLTGFLGVGGGFVVVPALALALRFPMHSAIGTSLAVITATGVLGSAVHFAAGRAIDADLTIVLTATMVIGALAGARLGQGMPDQMLARGFALLVSAVAVYLILSSALLGGPPG
jgi:uncharacterized membrane protein YfcA